jgi:hypothetical protein
MFLVYDQRNQIEPSNSAFVTDAYAAALRAFYSAAQRERYTA